jgi:hypothetical protein
MLAGMSKAAIYSFVGVLIVSDVISAFGFAIFWALEASNVWGSAWKIAPYLFAWFFISSLLTYWRMAKNLHEKQSELDEVKHDQRRQAWHTLEHKFRNDVDLNILAGWSRNVYGTEKWWLWGSDDLRQQHCEALINQGANMLLESHFLISNFPQVCGIEDHLQRWFHAYSLIFGEKLVESGFGHDLGGKHVSGQIDKVWERSSILCAKLAAQEYGPRRPIVQKAPPLSKLVS